MNIIGNRVLQVEGLDELSKMLTDIAPREANKLLSDAVFEIAVIVRDEMKRRVKKRTGKLAKSFTAIRKRKKGRSFFAEVRGGGGAPYMLMLEFGTRHSRAQPFITPTTESVRPRLTPLYKEKFGARYEKALAKEAKAK